MRNTTECPPTPPREGDEQPRTQKFLRISQAGQSRTKIVTKYSISVAVFVHLTARQTTNKLQKIMQAIETGR